MKREFYKILDVDENASKEVIKKAYRDKAKKVHPDKGGNALEMAALARAYNILSDDSKRKVYDSTGQETIKPFDEEVRTLILEAANNAFASDAKNILNFTKDFIINKRSEIKNKINNAEEEYRKLKLKRDKITSKNEENIFHMIIDDALGKINQAIEQMHHRIKLIDAGLEKLKEYKSTEEDLNIRDYRRNYGMFTMGS
jgi:curved DNA-binding protein CbpA